MCDKCLLSKLFAPFTIFHIQTGTESQRAYRLWPRSFICPVEEICASCNPVQWQIYCKWLQGHLLIPLNKISQNEWVGAIRPTCRAIWIVCGSSRAVKAFWALQTPCHTPRWAITPCRARQGSAAPHHTVMSRWTWSSTDCCLWRKTQ